MLLPGSTFIDFILDIRQLYTLHESYDPWLSIKIFLFKKWILIEINRNLFSASNEKVGTSAENFFSRSWSCTYLLFAELQRLIKNLVLKGRKMMVLLISCSLSRPRLKRTWFGNSCLLSEWLTYETVAENEECMSYFLQVWLWCLRGHGIMDCCPRGWGSIPASDIGVFFLLFRALCGW